MEQIGGELNELMSTKMCSPLMVYLAVIVTTGLSVYLTRDKLKNHGTFKMENLSNLYSLNELKFMIVFGLILFGLCQYNKTTLAWVFLIFPVIYLIIQNLIVHIHVSSAIQSSSQQATPQRRYGVEGGAMVIPQDTHKEVQEQQAIYVPPPAKNTAQQKPLSPMGMDAGPTGFSDGGLGGGFGSAGSGPAYF